jgi:hypothetical protein
LSFPINQKNLSPWPASVLACHLPPLLAMLLLVSAGSAATTVFWVHHKFLSEVGGDVGANISTLRAHHGCLIAAADLLIGSHVLPTDTSHVPTLTSIIILGDFPMGCLIWLWVLLGRSEHMQARLHGDQDQDAAQALPHVGRY